MNFKEVVEGKARIIVPDVEIPESARAYGFYNPSMKTNRNISIDVAKHYRPEKILDAFTATGVRAIRYCKEVGGDVHGCDVNQMALELAKRNARMNGCQIKFHFGDWRKLDEGFDLIDIDPYGSPCAHVDRAFQMIRNGGLIFVTATDVAALNGVYPLTSLRRYWVESKCVDYSKELGARILLSFVIREGAKYDKAFTPILTYQERHYIRVMGRVEKGARKTNDLLEKFSRTEHGFLYMGKIQNVDFDSDEKIVNLARNEVDVPFYYDIHKISKRFKAKLKPMEYIIGKLRELGYEASRTVFSPTGIKTNADESVVAEVLK